MFPKSKTLSVQDSDQLSNIDKGNGRKALKNQDFCNPPQLHRDVLSRKTRQCTLSWIVCNTCGSSLTLILGFNLFSVEPLDRRLRAYH